MKRLIKKQLILATVVYWFLLLYIIAALVFWYIALQRQNRQMATHRLLELRQEDPAYGQKVREVKEEEKVKTAQYTGEGLTFLLVILVGAVFIYRAVRKQFRMAQEQKNFMMAITHELKTPIAVTKLNLETLLKHKLDERKQTKMIQMTLEETERLNNLTNNILISSQLEAGGYRFAKEELDLSALSSDCLDNFRNRFPDYNWKAEIEADIEITGDGMLLQIMINNLLENAVKYSPKHSAITFAVKKTGQHIHMQVKDEGMGVPEEEKEKIFRRFYRVGNEKTRSTKGTGLGLFLCRKIASDHNGSIHVSDNSPAGSIFTVTFAA
jgi:two-component system, OmpR family, sensor histidine kinase CiaH